MYVFLNRPIEESTAGYIVAKQNISNTLLEVGKTFEYFKIASEVKNIQTFTGILYD